ncbi:unnamed protein product [Callosobruchus maculatus]|uniref:RNA-directed DNA polymerase n=1 Tax=Callosobruchus maculatus TaxID=64391 RepID=A0A653D205_CALMS|nr:unnamed protein product [Callosobruchus maculatus]
MSASTIVRWNVMLSAYQYQIEYRKGSQLHEADMLSRLPLKDITEIDSSINSFNLSEELPISYKDIAKVSSKDAVLMKVIDYVKSGWPSHVASELKPYYVKRNELSCEQNCLLKGTKVVIPEALRTQILELMHEDHIGIVRTKMLARSTLWWPNVNSDIENMINGCQVCQQSQNNQERFLMSWPKTENVFSRIHIDFFHAENKIFLLIVDSKSKWVDIHHIGKGTSIEPTIEKLKSTFSVMGLPDMIVSDNGPPFNSAEFTKFCHVNGIEVIKTPPYHPQSNGCAERHVQNVKDALNKYLLSKSTLKIEQRTVNFLFSYRNTPTSCWMSPNEIIFKVKPKTRLDLLKPKKGGQVDIKESEEFIRPPMFVVGEKVFVGKLGPYCKEKWKVGEIVKCVSAITYLVKVDDQVMYKHVNSLRKNMCNDQQLETVELRSPCVDKTPNIDLFCNPNMTPEPQPEPSSSQVASPALAESVLQRQTNDVMPGAEVPCLRRSTRARQAPKRLDL